jgi:hypothetical protein
MNSDLKESSLARHSRSFEKIISMQGEEAGDAAEISMQAGAKERIRGFKANIN